MIQKDILLLNKDEPLYKGYLSAIKRLSNRDYTRLEIKEYIEKRFDLNEEEIELILETLEDKRFLDDDRYIEDKISYFRYQYRGNQWILKDLLSRGLDETKILIELENEDDETYIQRGLKRAESFLKRSKGGSKVYRLDRLKQHLAYQGYEFNIIYEIINKIEDEYSKEDEYKSLEKIIDQARKRYARKFEAYELNQKIINYCLSKGYTYAMINKIMKEEDN